ncbi:HprK-related kinase A [Motiliproteus coralliicola]|uniref:HprK-related kinase A n=1 Tax=Motiliproteus coralliicola TaxID=2283196 RepID=A0A369WUH7_9GAMM|nr:HprK-related kinase A [Motiliproteus coralliicola]RDE24783.1 HprK-related kinase A [Motiliproteus coralliicola]
MPSHIDYFQAGRFRISLESNIPHLREQARLLYPDFQQPPYPFSDFHIQIKGHRSLGSLFRKEARFTFAERCFFTPLAYEHAFPLMEWGLNWCITNHLNHFVIIHGAVLAREDAALVLPGSPGSGKSTLCAALCFRPGWRLLSDELTLYAPDTKDIHSNPRPIALKNGSIDVIKKRHPQLDFTHPIEDTHKGTISYLKAPQHCFDLLDRPAKPSRLIFPKFDPNTQDCQLLPLPKGSAMIRLAEQTFNYGVLGLKAFEALNQFVRRCECYELTYDGDLDTASQQIEALMP